MLSKPEARTFEVLLHLLSILIINKVLGELFQIPFPASGQRGIEPGSLMCKVGEIRSQLNVLQ